MHFLGRLVVLQNVFRVRMVMQLLDGGFVCTRLCLCKHESSCCTHEPISSSREKQFLGWRRLRNYVLILSGNHFHLTFLFFEPCLVPPSRLDTSICTSIGRHLREETPRLGVFCPSGLCPVRVPFKPNFERGCEPTRSGFERKTNRDDLDRGCSHVISRHLHESCAGATWRSADASSACRGGVGLGGLHHDGGPVGSGEADVEDPFGFSAGCTCLAGTAPHASQPG